jgi:hypothetical protein
MLEQILKWLGAGDHALSVMGPTLTIALAWVFGGAAAQTLKYPLSRLLDAAWFDWSVRTLAIAATVGFAHLLSGSVPGVLEFGAGLSQPIVYWASLRVIRKYWPWMEVSAAVGSIDPPASAYFAADQRAAEKAGTGSGV